MEGNDLLRKDVGDTAVVTARLSWFRLLTSLAVFRIEIARRLLPRAPPLPHKSSKTDWGTDC